MIWRGVACLGRNFPAVPWGLRVAYARNRHSVTRERQDVEGGVIYGSSAAFRAVECLLHDRRSVSDQLPEGEHLVLRGKLARKAGALGISVIAFAGVAAAAPAQGAPTGANTVYADCSVGAYGKNSDGVWISCGDVVGGEARGRGDCTGAPDIYTSWVTGWQSSQNGWCWFSMRGAIMETRAS